MFSLRKIISLQPYSDEHCIEQANRLLSCHQLNLEATNSDGHTPLKVAIDVFDPLHSDLQRGLKVIKGFLLLGAKPTHHNQDKAIKVIIGFLNNSRFYLGPQHMAHILGVHYSAKFDIVVQILLSRNLLLTAKALVKHAPRENMYRSAANLMIEYYGRKAREALSTNNTGIPSSTGNASLQVSQTSVSLTGLSVL